MITVVGLDGSPLTRRAVGAVASATLLVGGRRHLEAVGWSPDGPACPTPPAGPDPAAIAAGQPATSPPPSSTDPGGPPPGGRPPGGIGPAATGPGDPHHSSTSGPGQVPAAATGPRVVVLGPLRPALDALAAHEGDAVVLASGDPGFFGIVRALRERGLSYVVLPATSSVAQAFARAGLPWDDAVVVSAHGRELRAAVNVCRAHPKVAVLTGPGQGPAEIGAALAGWPRRLLVAENLGAPGERITECTPADAADRTWADPNVLLVLADPHPAPLPAPASAPAPLPAPASAPAPLPAPASAPAPAPPVPAPSATPPAPGSGTDEFVIKRSVLPQRHQSSDHEEEASPDDPTSPLSHTGPTRRAAGPPSPADQSVIMTLVSSERHQSHDHESGGVPGVPSSLTDHTSLNRLGPGGGGPSSGGPDASGLGPGGGGPSSGGPDATGLGPGGGGPSSGGPDANGLGPGGSGPSSGEPDASGLDPGGDGPSSGEPDASGLAPGAPGPRWCWPLWTESGDQGWALGEEAFEHRDSMVTKPEVRALALARLGPRPGVLVWDVGAGSGSVAVECARFGAAVIAVDRDPAQCARVAANVRRHGTDVRVVGGAAPEALDPLPDPDAVFVGGGGLAVVSAVAARRPARIVVALAAVERAAPALQALADAGYTVDGTLLQASRLAPLPDGAHRLAAANPVFLLWADHDPGQSGAL